MECPRCGKKSKVTSFTYPKIFECEACGLIFLDLPNCLVDE